MRASDTFDARAPRLSARSRSVFHEPNLILVSLLLAAGCSRAPAADPGAEYRGFLLVDARPKVDFVLMDTEGQPFDFRERTDGYVTLVFFGYTYCPDICPVHMANIGAVLKEASPDVRGRVKVVFVTTDPERDTPEQIRTWLDNFDPSFIGLRGDMEKVNEIQVALGLPPAVKGEVEEDGSYLVGHSAYVLAFTSDNLAHLLYAFGTRQVDWASDLPKLVAENWE